MSPSKPTLYQEYQTKLTGDNTSKSMNNISSRLKSDKTKTVKYNKMSTKVSIFNPSQSCMLI